MGQYYEVTMLRCSGVKYFNRYVIPDKKGYNKLSKWNKEEVDKNGCYYTMAKLMEHSYVDNQFVDAITEELINNGAAQIAWVGDYAELPAQYAAFNPWDKEDEAVSIKYTTPAAKHLLSGKYIVNETKETYIDFDKYYKNNKWIERWTDNEGKNHRTEWCIHPIPLLTAIGNGLGGGDYHGTDMSCVGDWAFDLIRIADKAPEGYYNSSDITFTEG